MLKRFKNYSTISAWVFLIWVAAFLTAHDWRAPALIFGTIFGVSLSWMALDFIVRRLCGVFKWNQAPDIAHCINCAHYQQSPANNYGDCRAGFGAVYNWDECRADPSWFKTDD